MPPRDRDLLESIAAAHLPTGPIPFSDVLRMVVRDFGVEPVRHPGETAAAARDAAEHSFAEAGAALRASFAWWSGDEDA